MQNDDAIKAENEHSEDDEEEWHIIYRTIKPRAKKEKILKELTKEEKLDECKYHKSHIIKYVCTEVYCQEMFCEKCKGNHQNHAIFSIETAKKALTDNFNRNTEDIEKQLFLVKK